MSWDSQLSPQEAKYFLQLFQSVSKTQEGIVTGNEAVRFFATSGVPNEILSEIWEAADRDKVGYLTPETFSIALKLIACAQHGKEASEPVLATVVPLPQFDGVAPSPISTPLLSAPSLNNNASLITAAEREKYANIFKVHQPVNGVLDANTAKSVFLKSKLPMDTLSQIWYLADVRQSGSLNQSEFIIAMHYIAKLMDGTLSSLPDKLPPAVFQSANGNTTQQSPLVRNMTINSPAMGFRQPPPSHHMMTPPQRARTIDSLGNLAFGAAANEPAVQQWDVSARERQQFGAYFDKIDANHVGLIQGKEAVEFFKNSRLPETELAHIWDLADIQQRGALSRDEFAVAMYLIHKRLAGEQLPQTLPKTLIPPSHTPLQSPFTNVVSSPSMYHSTASPAVTQRSLPDHDLLGDFGNDGVAHETNQVNLLSNQVSSLSMHKTDVQQQKSSAEDTLEQLIKQRKDLEAQMASLRMAHEAAVKDLNEIQETVRREEGEWDQVRSEYDASQQELTAIQNEIAQTQQTLENGRAETESLRRRVHEIGEETKKAQSELENLRSQNKQTNMMLDINRRQVTAAEQDRSLAKRNLEDYKVAANLTGDGGEEEKQEGSIFTSGDSPVEPTTVSTPALQNLFGDSPSIGHASPFNEFQAEANKNATPAFDDAFSPAAGPSVSDNDFDAIFGNISSPASTNQTPVHAFDPWVATTPTTQVSTPGSKTSRGPPPPPPPQSRHHRQTSEVSSIASVVSTPSGAKKQRAPPPPPPVGLFSPTLSTPQINEQDDSEEDDFEAAFSGKLPEAKIVTKTSDDDDEFADFDDAFSSFDTVKPAAPAAPTTAQAETSATKSAAPAVDNWPSNFGGFNFASDDNLASKPSPTAAAAAAPTATKDDDWDSIFGTASSTPTAKAPVAETTSDGFDDAFSSFGDDFGKQSVVSTPTTAKVSVPVKTTQPQKSMSVGSIGIVGDKIEELVKIGFNEKEAKDALNRYDQDLEKATNFLLDQSSKA
ncbi:uncharacterized protein EV154DRAFT_440444 [Mucor mucedo]|uniref:uncharacterized protein n=1 Tax=Mucor mucedo TaxID=29922 RepID=UPI00221EFAC2|nr:uncharacterized protein EV154DRAFT_440444 [Mucor mucedo]KAI7893017.1 hypothetical protein EV154DRAFT_440444 [Mucor mucedo]